MPDGDSLKKVTPGQPFQAAAATWNSFIDAARKSKRLSVGGAGSAGQPIRTGAHFVTFKISSVVTSQVGRYNAKTFSGGIDAAATGNLAESDLGTLAAEDDAVVWHTPEIAGKGGTLSIDGIYQGRIVGTNSDGKLVILIGAAGGSTVKFGKATAAWTSGNTVTLDPCDSAGNDTGEPNVTASIFSPNRGTIAGIQINANDICTYLVTGTNTGVIVAVNFIPSPTGTSLGTAKYQVFQMTSNTTAGWDWVRAH